MKSFHRSRWQALLLALLPGLLSAHASAQPAPLELAFYVHCFSEGTTQGAQRLDYWSSGLARGNADPDCVAAQPILAPIPIQRVTHQRDDASEMDVVRLELDPASHAAIDRAMQAHLRRVIVITVRNRIVSTVFLTGAVTDHRIPVYVADRAAAAALVSDLTLLLGHAR